MKKIVVYLDRRRDVQVMRYLQRLQRVRQTAVVIRHHVFAKKLGCSESTIKRAIRRLVESGHIMRAYMLRPSQGGYLCAYRVRTDVIYRMASTMRRLNDLLPTGCEQALQGPLRDAGVRESRISIKNNNKCRRKRTVFVDKKLLKGFLSVARAAGASAKQQSYLLGAAYRYGVRETWDALLIALECDYPLDKIDRITWGILKRWFPKEADA